MQTKTTPTILVAMPNTHFLMENRIIGNPKKPLDCYTKIKKMTHRCKVTHALSVGITRYPLSLAGKGVLFIF